MEAEILRLLRDIEAQEHCRILLAVAVGSRAWGVAAPDSDYDIRFLYCRTPLEYLSLHPLPDVIEEKREEMDIEGWDLRKALKLLRDGNPSLYEWFSSPVCYRNSGSAEAIKALLPQCFDPSKILHCYHGMADRVRKTFLKSEMVPVKRYLHTIWCILLCRWTLDRGTLPPMSFETLMKAELDPAVAPVVRDLIQRRRKTLALGPIPKVESLNRYIDEQMAAISQEIRTTKWDKPKKIPWETLDELFFQAIFETETE